MGQCFPCKQDEELGQSYSHLLQGGAKFIVHGVLFLVWCGCYLDQSTMLLGLHGNFVGKSKKRF